MALARHDVILREAVEVHGGQAAKAKAQAAGKTELVQRIDHRLDMLQKRLDKVNNRLARIKARCRS